MPWVVTAPQATQAYPEVKPFTKTSFDSARFDTARFDEMTWTTSLNGGGWTPAVPATGTWGEQ